MKNKTDIIQQIKKSGADFAGACPFSEDIQKLFNVNSPLMINIVKDKFKENEKFRSIIVAGMHIEDPYLDAWTYLDNRNPMSLANQYLGQILSNTCVRLEREGYHSVPLLYSSLYLKDAACHAKLGVIGKNNLLVTPEFGPRIRLRALLTEAEVPIEDKELVNPCGDCDAPCIKACPVNAFASGKYDRDTCYEYAKNNLKKVSSHTYLWCRECELACPVGN